MRDFRTIGSECSNWSRWGATDERGTTNLITQDRVAAAAGLVRSGKVLSLAMPFAFDGPHNFPRSSPTDRINPVHLMASIGLGQTNAGGLQYADDYIFMPLQCGTQWDAISHVFYDDVLYNGFSAAESISTSGAVRCSVGCLQSTMIGRGILLDIAALIGVKCLPLGFVITPAMLDDAACAAGVEVCPGDIILIRTGWSTILSGPGSAAEYMSGEPGIGLSSACWLRERDVAAVCSDNWALEVIRVDAFGNKHGEIDDLNMMVHMVLLRDVGMPIGEMFDLEELATLCAALGRWEFLFVGPPLPITGGVGSPINPLAIM